MISIGVDNQLTISGLPPWALSQITESLTIPNPQYHVLLRMGNVQSLYNVKKDFKYYTITDDGDLLVGRGLLKRLISFCQKNKLEYQIITKTNDPLFQKTACADMAEIPSRPYQEGVSTRILAAGNEGILQLGTGWGKTILSLQLIKETRLKTLIIVPKDAIMGQFIAEIKKFWGQKILGEVIPGVIQGKKWETDRDVVIASANTMTRNPKKVAPLKDQFGMVIVDEAHQFITDKRMALIQSFAPARLYGLTATPDRSDGQGEAIKFIFGDILISDALPSIPPKVRVVVNNSNIEMDVSYADMIKAQTEDEERNTLIRSIVQKEVDAGRKVLVLTKRILHYEYLSKGLKGKVFCINSENPSKIRRQLLSELRKQEVPFDCIMGTFSMLSTGVDIPTLDTLVIAGDLKSSVLTMQSAGRIMRLFEGKKEPLIYDIMDRMNPILRKQARERQAAYKKWGWVVDDPSGFRKKKVV